MRSGDLYRGDRVAVHLPYGISGSYEATVIATNSRPLKGDLAYPGHTKPHARTVRVRFERGCGRDVGEMAVPPRDVVGLVRL